MKNILLACLAINIFSIAQAQKGLSLHIGINEVDPGHYGEKFPLLGCVNDSLDLMAFTKKEGYDSTLLTNQMATVDTVTAIIKRAAQKLERGDVFLMSVAAHGSQLPDLNGDEKELNSNDIFDETWAMYDRMWIDDERGRLWNLFKEGVKIIVIADTCHSGTSVKSPKFKDLPPISDGPGGGSAFYPLGLRMNGMGVQKGLQMEDEKREALRGALDLSDDDDYLSKFSRVDARSDSKLPGMSAGSRTRGRGYGDTEIVRGLSLGIRSLARQDTLNIYERNLGAYKEI